jgi:Zn-finger in ubiquitin-hydrolases and other protein
MVCAHAAQIQEVEPTADGCEDCLKRGDDWVHLRLCLSCGHVGCCDDSKNKHATKHFRDAEHPIIQSFEPGEDWRRASSTRSSWSSGEEPLDHDEERWRQRMSQGSWSVHSMRQRSRIIESDYGLCRLRTSSTTCRKACPSGVGISKASKTSSSASLRAFMELSTFVSSPKSSSPRARPSLQLVASKERRETLATRQCRLFAHVWTVRERRLQRLRAFTDTAVLAKK